MKRFRYRLSLVFILMTLVAIAFSWVGWPMRTAVVFVEEQYRKNIDIECPFREGTSEFVLFEKRKPQLLQIERERISRLKLVPHTRSVADILAGRQTFDFGMEEFTICRGKVVSGPTSFFTSVFRYYR